MRITLGNMPPRSKANLRVYCSQRLEIEDMSYCLRIPMAYVPAYMGNASNFVIPAEENQVEDPVE